MERRESAQERVAELTERVGVRPGQDRRRDRPPGRGASRSSTARSPTVTKEREVIAGTVPADLLKLYDKLREQQGGVGAARLYQRTLRGLPPGAGHHRGQRGPRGRPRHGACAARTAAASWSVRPSRVCRDGDVREFIVEADGGSRGNPGPAGYGAVVIDAATGETLAEARRVHRRRDEQRRRVPGPDRRPARRAALDPDGAGPRPDGLQARRRADVGPLEDQAPGHEAAGGGGRARSSRPAGSRTSGSRASRTSTRTGSPTRRWTRASGASSGTPSRPRRPWTAVPATASRQPSGRRRRGAGPPPSARPALTPCRTAPPPRSAARSPSRRRTASAVRAASPPSAGGRRRPRGARHLRPAAARRDAAHPREAVLRERRQRPRALRRRPAAGRAGRGRARRAGHDPGHRHLAARAAAGRPPAPSRPGSGWRSASRTGCARRTSAPGRG